MPAVYGPWQTQTDVTTDATGALDVAFESRIINSGTTQYDTWATQISGGFGDMSARLYDPGPVPYGERVWWLRQPADPGDPILIQGVAHSLSFGANYELLVTDLADDDPPDGYFWDYEDTYLADPVSRLVQVEADIEIIPAVPFPGATITTEDMTVVAYKSDPTALGYVGLDPYPTSTSTTGRTSSDVQGFSSRQQTTLGAAATSTSVTLTFTTVDILSSVDQPPAARFEVVPWGYSGDGPPSITGSTDFSGGSAVLRPTLTLTYHRARKRLGHIITNIPPLRHLQRDDDARQFVASGPTSAQATARQGPRGTYL